MRSSTRLKKQRVVDIQDYYALRIGPMWRGLREESWAFWWLCIYFFFEYVRPQSIYSVIDVLPWTQISLIAALLTMRTDKTVTWVKSPANTVFILFYLLVFLSCLFAFHPATSWGKISIVINWIVAYFLIVMVVNSERRFFIFLLLFLLANFKMSQFGFRSFAMRGFSFAGWGVSGSPGWFQNAGDFGLQMNIFAPLAAVFVYELRKYWSGIKKLLLYMLPISALITIIATSSRGAQLGLVGITLLYILRSRLGLKSLLTILVLGWGLYQVLPAEMLEKFETAGEDKTSQARLKYWEFGMDVARENPVFGVGYENWLEYCWYKNPRGIEYGMACLDPHNTFIEAAAEIGIPGLSLYVIMLMLVLVINGRTRKKAKKLGNNFIFYMAHGLDAGLVGYMISSFFVTVLFYPMFWFQLALTVALHALSMRMEVTSPDETASLDEPAKDAPDSLAHLYK